MNPLQRLNEAGQSVWLDFLRRGLITGGSLERMTREDSLTGVTSNPSIFGKAIGGSTDYDEAIRAIVDKVEGSPLEVFYGLALADIQMAADVLRPVHERTGGADGFVSFELEPRLAHDTAGSIEAARELFGHIGKPNVMIKVPGTKEGVAAVEDLIAAGVNVNITLLFSIGVYERVALAYLAGLERRLEAGEPLDRVASVASFFVSRVDTAVEASFPRTPPFEGRWPWPTRSSRISGSGGSSGARGGTGSPPPVPGCNGRCGPPLRRRTRSTGTSCTWKSWSGPTPSTPCPVPPWTRSGTTAGSGRSR